MAIAEPLSLGLAYPEVDSSSNNKLPKRLEMAVSSWRCTNVLAIRRRGVVDSHNTGQIVGSIPQEQANANGGQREDAQAIPTGIAELLSAQIDQRHE